MSSLQSIMNVDEDQHDASPSTDKKDKDPATPASGFRGQNPSSSLIPPGHVIRSSQQPPSTQLAEGSEVHRSGQQQQHADEGTSPGSTVQQGKRRAVAIDPLDRTPAATATASTFRAGQDRRESNTSVDSMDQHGYGSAASSSSMGGGAGGLPPNHPRRPMGSPSREVPIRLTPITGRVSRAKKGVPVHTCEMCNPPKTFTRAEHLRRHQLSHQTPRYPCTYPGCERAFHRPDLLTRHQQRHEQEGDKVSISGEGSRRDSTASENSGPPDNQMPVHVGRGLQPPPSFRSRSFKGPPAPTPPSSMPPATANVPQPYPPEDSPRPGPKISPSASEYDTSASQRFSTFPERLPVISQPGSMSPSPVPPPMSVFVSPGNHPGNAGALPTSLGQPPELIDGAECSSWTSSPESTYSTPPPKLGRSQEYWQPRHQPHVPVEWQPNGDMLSSFTTQPDIHGTGGLGTVTTSQFGTPQFSIPTHMTYGTILDPALMATFADDQSVLDTSITSHYLANHRPSSVRSPSHPSSSGLAADALVAPAALPTRPAPMAQVIRRKEIAVGGGNIMSGVDIYGDGNSPGWPSNDPSDILTGSALEGGGGCGSGGMTAVTPLPRSVHNSIPSYLDVYWDRFHALYPFIHKGMVDGVGEDALRCAMAAIATQFLDNKDDRIRGNQLHEFASQEAKRHTQASQWSLQVKEAIVLCEVFSRFRGRKASVRSSKLFENLYSRVSGSESLVSSVSGGGRSSLCVTRSGSSSVPSMSSSAAVFTPSLPAWSPPSSEPTSASSPCNGLYQFDHARHGSSSVLFSPTVSFSPPQISSSPDNFVLNPGFQPYNNVSFNNAYYPFSTGQEQSYSDSFSPQVLESTPAIFNTAPLGNNSMEVNSANEERWHTWINEEARRRLLSVCFILDNHTSLYHQQPRARDDIDPSTIPLTGHSDGLWAATSATEWASILETSPAANIPRFVPPPNTLTPEEVARHSCLDQAGILHAEASRLLRRPYGGLPNGIDDQNTYTADDLRTPTATSYNQGLGGAYPEERLVHLFSMTSITPGPSIYLALYHTPLHDLLAVSGDSWVFSQKVLCNSTFSENQKRLRAWAEGRPPSKSSSTQQQAAAGSLEGMSCAQATCHAARALLAFLGGDGSNTARAGCISDYWGMYVCALIIWAFGHRASRSSSSTSPQKSPLAEDEAISWLGSVARIRRPEDALRIKHRREASAGVVSLVKRRLHADCVGPRSQLYVDAVSVLKKLEEGANWRRF